jgi:hypothetical protein
MHSHAERGNDRTLFITDFGFFLQPLALCMNLLCPVIAPSLRPSSQKTVTRTCKSDETV